jgi:hypothetical protein
MIPPGVRPGISRAFSRGGWRSWRTTRRRWSASTSLVCRSRHAHSANGGACDAVQSVNRDGEGRLAGCPHGMQQPSGRAGKVGGTPRGRCRGGGYPCRRPTPRGRPSWQQSLAVCLDGQGVLRNARSRDGRRARERGAERASPLGPSTCCQAQPAGNTVVMALAERWPSLPKHAAYSGAGQRESVMPARSWRGQGSVVRQPPCHRGSTASRAGT